jgi:predicted DNA-binding transcriptional regulator AlpA
MSKANLNNAKFIPAKRVRERYGSLSAMWLWRRLRDDPTFPRPVTFGTKARFWNVAELDAWDAAHKRAA